MLDPVQCLDEFTDGVFGLSIFQVKSHNCPQQLLEWLPVLNYRKKPLTLPHPSVIYAIKHVTIVCFIKASLGTWLWDRHVFIRNAIYTVYVVRIGQSYTYWLSIYIRLWNCGMEVLLIFIWYMLKACQRVNGMVGSNLPPLCFCNSCTQIPPTSPSVSL